MKIFYTASYYGKEQYQKDYDLVLNTLKKHNIELVGTEVGNYISTLPEKLRLNIKDKNILHYEAIKQGITGADAVIIEVSHQDFQIGHESTLAILSKKHVLCLSIHEDFSQKIRNEYFHGARYNKYNINEVIEEFINTVKQEKLNTRFNMFLSDRQIKYLQTISLTENLNMSEYIRKLIEDDLQVKG